MEHHHEHTPAVLNRLSRAAGHLASIRSMVEEGRDCADILIQLAAVKAAINGIGKIVLQDHMQHCIRSAVETGDQQAIDDFIKAIDQFIK